MSWIDSTTTNRPPACWPKAIVRVVTVRKKGDVIRKPNTDESSPDKTGNRKIAAVNFAYVTPRRVRYANDVGHEEFCHRSAESGPMLQNRSTLRSLTDGTQEAVLAWRNSHAFS